jgi:Ni/Co efflux regulator RcnB
MKKMILTLAATAAALTGLAGTAQAAPFGSNVNQKEAQIATRIDQGMRSGALTRGEAQNLRIRLAQVQRLEQAYRRGGLNMAERRDLDRRLDALSASVRVDKHDRDFRRR